LRLRECHAGRGIYRIPVGSERMLSCLHSNPAAEVLLQSTQRDILDALGCWPYGANPLQWYAGSALINAFTLAGNHPSLHSLDLYEWQPETRKILRSVLTAAQPEMHSSWSALPEEELGQEFDGEAYIERQISQWGKQDVVLLDPFAMWRGKEKHDQSKRNRYGAIVDALINHRDDAPSLILFWTWGNAFLVARGDLNGTNKPVKNGYHELRSRLHLKEFRFLRVKWCWGLQFAMWVVVPKEHLEALRHDIDVQCGLLSNHLERQRCRFKDQRVEVLID
jgi:hypothetical protein